MQLGLASNISQGARICTFIPLKLVLRMHVLCVCRPNNYLLHRQLLVRFILDASSAGAMGGVMQKENPGDFVLLSFILEYLPVFLLKRIEPSLSSRPFKSN